MVQADTLLINVQAPLYEFGGDLYLDNQACNGLRLWTNFFAYVTAMIPVIEGNPPPHYVRLDNEIRDYSERIQIERLPWAYRPDHFLKASWGIRPRIAELIQASEYLNFAIGGGLFGDWGAVACREAHRQGRPYAVWTDRVESQVVRSGIGKGPWRKSLQARLYHRPMAALEKSLIRHSALGLFHGRETYDIYSPYCRNPHVVHDIHISRSDHLSAEGLEAKQLASLKEPLSICYVGRIDPMKGPYDWISVIEGLQARGVQFEAVWLGSGAEEVALRAYVRESGLEDSVCLPGFASDREEVLEVLRRSHLMLFCHKTPESPRCLIEALISGCAIVGYDSPYPRDLVAPAGGGVLTPLNDIGALTEAVAGLAEDRSRLARLMWEASQSSAFLDDVSVFKHRSKLIKTFLREGL